jgi:ribosome modulation factor
MNLAGRPKVIDHRTVYHKNRASGQGPRSSESDFLGGRSHEAAPYRDPRTVQAWILACAPLVELQYRDQL